MRRAFGLFLAVLPGSGAALAQKAPTLRTYFSDPATVRKAGVKLIPIQTPKGTFKDWTKRFVQETVSFGMP